MFPLVRLVQRLFFQKLKQRLRAFVLVYDMGIGGQTAFSQQIHKLRDLGTALGFTVGWSGEQGVFIQTK